MRYSGAIRICIIWYFIVIGVTCSAMKILGIFPAPFKSHFTCTNAVMKSLLDAGHEVTIVTPFSQEIAGDNYSSVVDLSKELPPSMFISQISYNEFSNLPLYPALRMSLDFERPFCDRLYNSKAFQELLASKNASFDVVFIEVLQTYKCYLPIAKKLNIPVIGVTTLRSWYYSDLAIKSAFHPADVPFELGISWRFHRFWDRMHNMWSYIVVRYFWYFEIVPFLEGFHRRHENMLKDYEGYLDIEPVLMFNNGHHTILPRSLNPNVIEIGGIQVRPAKPLPKNIQKFIDEAKNGVILFTLGSYVKGSTLPVHVVNVFLEVFSKIPQRVIWKFEEPLENVPDNVMISKWLPQRDILEHRNVKAFISHCGMGGTYEAICTSTPVIACPLEFDQPTNAAILEHLGVAVHLDVEDITRESLYDAIERIINDTRYYDKMQKVSRAFKDRPLTPQQSVVFWTEYVVKYRDILNLKPPSSELNLFEYYLLDIVCIVLLVCSCFYYLLKQIMNLVTSMLTRKIKVSVVSKNKLN